MKINFLSVCTLAFLTLFVLACKPCQPEVKFGVSFANKYDTVRIFVNDTLIAKRIIKDSSYFYESNLPGALLTRYCAKSDSFHVRVAFNAHDTSFYIHSMRIGSCFVGNSIEDSLCIFLGRRIKKEI
jgi:hypothetical protein